jgi:hypothetical protein
LIALNISEKTIYIQKLKNKLKIIFLKKIKRIKFIEINVKNREIFLLIKDLFKKKL